MRPDNICRLIAQARRRRLPVPATVMRGRLWHQVTGHVQTLARGIAAPMLKSGTEEHAKQGHSRKSAGGSATGKEPEHCCWRVRARGDRARPQAQAQRSIPGAGHRHRSFEGTSRGRSASAATIKTKGHRSQERVEAKWTFCRIQASSIGPCQTHDSPNEKQDHPRRVRYQGPAGPALSLFGHGGGGRIFHVRLQGVVDRWQVVEIWDQRDLDAPILGLVLDRVIRSHRRLVGVTCR
jgi:hypothetical protein